MLAALALAGAGCGDDDSQATCGNGKLGLSEDCDCGQDASNLPIGCTAPNGVPGANCTADCRRIPAEDCDNGADDDLDGQTDCDDSDCEYYPACVPEICNDGVDNNGNGLADCDDSQCEGAPECDAEICGNGLDDNLDGHTDCQDLQCYAEPDCLGVEVCWNELDDNGNGFVDCDDAQCQGTDACLSQEDCSNGEDDDGDGRVDCADRSCIEAAPCVGTSCGQEEIDLTVSLDASNLSAAVAHVSIDVPSAGDDLTGACDIQNGKEYVLAVNALTPGRLRVVYTQHGQGKHNIGLYLKGGTGTGCTAALNQCAHLASGVSGVLDYGVVPSSKYFLVVSEGVTGGAGQVDLTVSLAAPLDPSELCDSDFDEDGNGQLDCGDVACFNAVGICAHSAGECGGSFDPADLADETLGELAPTSGGNSWNLVDLSGIDTRLETSDFTTSCMEFGGADRRIHFRLTAPAYIQVGYLQNMNGNGDHVVSLGVPGGVDPTSGQCRLVDHVCVDTVGSTEGLVRFPGDPAQGGLYPPGDYYLGVKAHDVPRQGRIDLQLILRTEDVEVCDDWGFDEDGNGQANCADTSCSQHHLCLREDCDNGVDDDNDGRVDCTDQDADDPCACSFQCRGRANSCDPNRPVEGYNDGDPEIVYLGTIPKGSSRPFDLTTVGKDTHYGAGAWPSCVPAETAQSPHPDVVLMFDIVETANIRVSWTIDGTAEHVGALYEANRCASCADESSFIYCFAVPGLTGDWNVVGLLAGTYVFIVKPYWSPTGARVYGDVLVLP